MNTAILFAEITVVFGALTICYKLFGKAGAIAWVIYTNDVKRNAEAVAGKKAEEDYSDGI